MICPRTPPPPFSTVRVGHDVEVDGRISREAKIKQLWARLPPYHDQLTAIIWTVEKKKKTANTMTGLSFTLLRHTTTTAVGPHTGATAIQNTQHTVRHAVEIVFFRYRLSPTRQ